jgi:lipoate synthase
VTPARFAAWEQTGAAMGLRLRAAPFVRSSYRAGELL